MRSARQKLDELQEKHGAVLPTEYASFLLENEGGGDVELDGGFWMMASLLPTGGVGVQPLTLDSDFSLDMLPPVPFFRAPSACLFKQVGDRFPKAEVTSLDGEPFSFDRLRSATCIGEDNGRTFFSLTQSAKGSMHSTTTISAYRRSRILSAISWTRWNEPYGVPRRLTPPVKLTLGGRYRKKELT